MKDGCVIRSASFTVILLCRPYGMTQSIECRADGLITQMTYGNVMITVMDHNLQGRMLDKTLLAQEPWGSDHVSFI